MRHPGVEPGPPRWQRGIIAARLMAHLIGRIRTIDLGITAESIYSPPLYQLSYDELAVCRIFLKINSANSSFLNVFKQ